MVVSQLVNIIQLLMIVRAILSWNPRFHGTRISEMLYQLTEPFIFPMRQLFDRFSIGRGYGMIAIDWPYLATFLVLSAIPQLLYRILL